MTNHRLITGVDFVVVPTDAFDDAVAFYGEVLKLPCIDRYGGVPGAEFQAGNKALGREFRPNTMPIALQVDDVDAARAELEGAGVTFLGDTFDTGVCRQAIFTDPDSNPLVLHHRYAPPKPKPDVA
jgi:predicted enzyme related to lactoylglutathione lyase